MRGHLGDVPQVEVLRVAPEEEAREPQVEHPQRENQPVLPHVRMSGLWGYKTV